MITCCSLGFVENMVPISSMYMKRGTSPIRHAIIVIMDRTVESFDTLAKPSWISKSPTTFPIKVTLASEKPYMLMNRMVLRLLQMA